MPTIMQVRRRLTGAAGAPAGVNYLEGELAVNLQDSTKPEFWVWGGDPAGTAPANKGWVRLNQAGVQVGTTAPTAPSNGDTWVDTNLTPPLLKVYNGTNWIPVGAQASATAPANPYHGQIWVDTTGGVGNAVLKTYSGSAWLEISPTITTQNLNLTAHNAAADIGAAYVAAGSPAITGDIVIATWGAPASAYMLTGAAPATAGNWTSLGGSVTFASDAQILAGTVANVAIDPAGLQSRMTATPDATPANDARKIVQLNAQGKIDDGFLELDTMIFRGSVDLTAAPPSGAGAWNQGDFGMVSADALQAAQDAGWALGVDASQGDLVVYDGTTYSLITASTNLGNSVLRAGANPVAADMSMTWIAPSTLTTVLDGTDATKTRVENFTLDNCVIDGGTY